MKTHFRCFATITLLLLLANQLLAQGNILNAKSAAETKSRRQPIREVALSGTGYELGLQHGQIFRKER